jgi:hypothetical protein
MMSSRPYMRLRPMRSAAHPKTSCPMRVPTGVAIFRPRSWFAESYEAQETREEDQREARALSNTEKKEEGREKRTYRLAVTVNVPDHTGSQVDGEDVVGICTGKGRGQRRRRKEGKTNEKRTREESDTGDQAGLDVEPAERSVVDLGEGGTATGVEVEDLLVVVVEGRARSGVLLLERRRHAESSARGCVGGRGRGGSGGARRRRKEKRERGQEEGEVAGVEFRRGGFSGPYRRRPIFATVSLAPQIALRTAWHDRGRATISLETTKAERVGSCRPRPPSLPPTKSPSQRPRSSSLLLVRRRRAPSTSMPCSPTSLDGDDGEKTAKEGALVDFRRSESEKGMRRSDWSISRCTPSAPSRCSAWQDERRTVDVKLDSTSSSSSCSFSSHRLFSSSLVPTLTRILYDNDPDSDIVDDDPFQPTGSTEKSECKLTGQIESWRRVEDVEVRFVDVDGECECPYSSQRAVPQRSGGRRCPRRRALTCGRGDVASARGEVVEEGEESVNVRRQQAVTFFPPQLRDRWLSKSTGSSRRQSLEAAPTARLKLEKRRERMERTQLVARRRRLQWETQQLCEMERGLSKRGRKARRGGKDGRTSKTRLLLSPPSPPSSSEIPATLPRSSPPSASAPRTSHLLRSEGVETSRFVVLVFFVGAGIHVVVCERGNGGGEVQ